MWIERKLLVFANTYHQALNSKGTKVAQRQMDVRDMHDIEEIVERTKLRQVTLSTTSSLPTYQVT